MISKTMCFKVTLSDIESVSPFTQVPPVKVFTLFMSFKTAEISVCIIAMATHVFSVIHYNYVIGIVNFLVYSDYVTMTSYETLFRHMGFIM